MDVELIEIRDFIASHHPFNLLPKEETTELARQVSLRYLRRGAVLMEPGEQVQVLSLVRTGALETVSPEGHLLARLDEGQAAGVRALQRGGLAVNRIQAIEDSLLYQLPAEHFHRLRETYPSFAYFFASETGGRLRGTRQAEGGPSDTLGLTTRRVGELLRRKPISVPRGTSIREAASLMTRMGISCLLVVEEGELCGILTDRDLRSRVLAAGRDTASPVEAIMSAPPFSVQSTAWLFEALMMMSRHNIHHLPVVNGKVPVGVVTTTDLLRTQTRSVVFLASDVHRRDDAEGIRETTAQIPDLVFELVESGASAYTVGNAITAIADAATERLIQLAEAELGPPPVPYCWIACGSQARFEQTAKSDQDNCLLISDDFRPEEHGPWFKDFATRVCRGLDTAGYILCPGDVMAMNDKWRQPLAVWKRYFRKWIDQPDPMALMLSSVFFDMRPISGDTALFEELHDEVLRRAKGNRIFLAHMMGNALTHQPPLGFFRNFVLISGGEHNRTLDLKHSGIVPIVDLARIYCLDAGLPQLNTYERLQAAREAGVVSRQGADDLEDALAFLGLVRLRHQASQIRAGEEADNYMPPSELSGLERGYLKDAFAVVKSMQSAASTAYRGGRG
ncbi:putative nucleotidyltransferase substrate binding domain-containing protein [Telmatospirillum sp. J64-1]|uniref:putative nucleotidyltransferase substrate binding domain-containing protein n=1 Tax=Telmatospirillum sp. J64-1 TaxID=2502183 RepID=UPI00115DBB0E|nr:putative nucleotidyltransferase substrate binding domain-containing protein [Telmatospirillum sp. J64-1]